MDVYDDSDTIGDTLAIRASDGDELILTTPKVSDLRILVRESPDGVPVEAYQTKELICDVVGQDEVVALYAQTTEMSPRRTKYDVHALRLKRDGDSEELGEILAIETDI